MRRGTAAAWTAANPTLGSGEMGLETDTGKLKFGDGATAWNSLAYFAGSGSGITTLASPGGTIGITNPSGPTADIDLPSSGVSAGSYGSSTQVPRITVTADGIVTALANVGIGGLPGSGLVQLFSSTLGVAGTLDTGAGGVPGGHGDLIVVASVQMNSASTGAVFMQLNADSASTYTQRYLVDGVFSTTSTVGGVSFGMVIASNAGTLPSIVFAYIPRYDDTTVQKSMLTLGAAVGTRIGQGGAAWPSTAAITEIMLGANIPSSVANFKAGGKLTIYGTQ